MHGFDDFWAKYPRRQAKLDAQKAWAKLRPSPELQADILTALIWQTASDQWQRGYVPLPASYLRGRRWEDEPPKRLLTELERKAISLLNTKSEQQELIDEYTRNWHAAQEKKQA